MPKLSGLELFPTDVQQCVYYFLYIEDKIVKRFLEAIIELDIVSKRVKVNFILSKTKLLEP